MQFEEFVNRVQERANVDRDEAAQLIDIVMTVLAEPLSRDETNLLASQLPAEVKTVLARNREEPIPSKQTMRSYSVEEFHNRVKARLGVRYQQGVAQAQAVLSVVGEAVPESVIDAVLRDLPEGYGPLFAPQGQAE